MCRLTEVNGMPLKESDCGKCDCPQSRVQHQPDDDGVCRNCLGSRRPGSRGG